MTSLPEVPDAADLSALRDEIDDLQQTPVEQLVSPEPSSLVEELPTPSAPDAIGSEKWDEPADEEVTQS